MEQEYVKFLKSDAMILTYEIIVLIALTVSCIILSKRQKRMQKEDEQKKERIEWEQLQNSLQNDRKSQKGVNKDGIYNFGVYKISV